MNMILHKKSWWNRNWKWMFPLIGIVFMVVVFFSMTGDATFRYGSIYIQPALVDNALEKAKENERVIEKLGELSPHDFFRLLEGEVEYSNNNKTVAVTVGIVGSKGRAKLDILADQKGNNWEYQKITVRIKKPKKETIKILEK